jgi:hypothetical protein
MNLYFQKQKVEIIGFGRQYPNAANCILNQRIWGFWPEDLMTENGNKLSKDDILSIVNNLDLTALINRLKDPCYPRNYNRRYFIDYVGSNETLTETHKRLLKMYSVKEQ